MIEYGHIIVTSPFKMSFIPSLENIAKIGSAEEIIDILSDVYSLREHEFLGSIENPSEEMIKYVKKSGGRKAFKSAMITLNACCDRDPSELVGYFKESGAYVPGIESLENIVEIAKALLKNGVIGKSSRKDTNDNSKKSTGFSVVDYINMGRVHLELSKSESQCMTMTELIMMMETKFPEDKSKEPSTLNMSKKDYQEKMKKAKEIQDKITAQRGLKK